MRKKTNKSFFASDGKDVLSLINNIQKIITTKPNTSQMFEEVQMMKFKIKPIHGDVSAFNLKNTSFIESLWSLGKLDEFFHREFPQLSKKDQEVFLRFFDNLYFRYQQQLSKINLQPAKTTFTKIGSLELEIYKEGKLKKKVN